MPYSSYPPRFDHSNYTGEEYVSYEAPHYAVSPTYYCLVGNVLLIFFKEIG
jgi:hypothetical protein